MAYSNARRSVPGRKRNKAVYDDGLPFKVPTIQCDGLSLTGYDMKALIPTKFNLTSTWAAYGDSFTFGVGSNINWAARLATLTGTTVVNNAVNSTTVARFTNSNPTTLINDLLKTPAYDKYSSIIAYGFNDIRNNKSLYADVYLWQQVYMNAVLAAALPQSAMDDARTGWTESGTWANTTVSNHGRYTATQNDYTEKVITGRYYAFSFLNLYNEASNWEVKMDGVIELVNIRAATQSQGDTYHARAVLLDMGTSAARTVRVTNKNASTPNQYFQWCAAWDDTTVGMKDVLCLGIPKFDFAYTGASPWDAGTGTRRLLFDDGIQDVARTCSALGVPVYYLPTINMGCLDGDQVHWRDGAHIQRAKRIKTSLA